MNLLLCAVYAAEEGLDFNRTVHNMTFTPNEPLRTKKCFMLETYDDNIYEGKEQYGIHMVFDHQFTSVNSPARLFIKENDGETRESEEGEGGGRGKREEGRGGERVGREGRGSK